MQLRRILFLIAAISFSPLLRGQQLFTKSQQQVQQAVVNFFEALSKRDSVELKNYCTADIVLYENGSTWNIDTLILKTITLNTAIDFRRTNSFEFVSTTVKKNTAWVTYNLHSEMIRNGKPASAHWMETVIIMKEKKQWKIKLLHSTLIKRS